MSGFNPQKIKTNPNVAAFYKRIGVITEEMVAEVEERCLDSFQSTSSTSLTMATASETTPSTSSISVKLGGATLPNIFVVRL